MSDQRRWEAGGDFAEVLAEIVRGRTVQVIRGGKIVAFIIPKDLAFFE